MATDIGASREENQDRVGAMRVYPQSRTAEPFIVVAVADGMGGMRDGAGCAARTLAVFFASMADTEIADPVRRVEFAAHQANAAVFDLYGGSGGATLSAICVALTGKAALVNVGDSRIYGGSEKDAPPIQRLTVDDSLEEAVGGHGRELLQFVGMGDGLKAHVSLIKPDTQRLLITSDGIHFISHDALCDIFWKAPDIYRAAERLTAMARWCGSPDNASLAVVDLKRLRDDFGSATDASVSVWDSFSSAEFHAPSSAPQPDRLKQKPVAEPNRTQTTESRAVAQTNDSAEVKKSKKRRSRKEASQETKGAEGAEGPQLVIQIDGDTDSTASEKSGEASK
ncbi:protein phosphatase 2C domain-containing protein [Paraburkholderia nemoris]|uniref:PP2C family protein-serine/threonine phosphatase n=1 Tax=Paraburkholderia nemoris TaxID=2793076 RepID=UPI0038BC20A8